MLSSVSGVSSFLGFKRLLLSLSNLLSEMFFGKYSSSTSWRASCCPQSWQSTVWILEEIRCLRQQVQLLCWQWGIIRGWLAAEKGVLQRQQTSSSSFCIKYYHSKWTSKHWTTTQLNKKTLPFPEPTWTDLPGLSILALSIKHSRQDKHKS